MTCASVAAPAPDDVTEAVAAILDAARARRRLPPPAKRREIREAAQLPLREIAHAVGVSVDAVSRWELGTRTPRGRRLTAYVAVLDALREAA